MDAANNESKSGHMFNLSLQGGTILLSTSLTCLKIAPGWEGAVSLKRVVDERVVLHGLIGMGITAFAAGLFVGGLAAFVRDLAASLAKKD